MKAAGNVIQISVEKGRQELSIVVFVGVWWLVAHLGSLPSYILPSPEKAGATFLVVEARLLRWR